MVRAYHLVLTAYGSWLPNDPRGSWSDFVRSWELLKFGKATKTDERRSLAGEPHDHRARLEAKRHLKRRPVEFDGKQARAIARGFADYLERSGAIIHACSILPTHVHAIVARHRYNIVKVGVQLKAAATRQLREEGMHPFGGEELGSGRPPTPWAHKQWSVFLSDDAHIRNAIRYVEQNPMKEGKKVQQWSFVQPIDV